LSVVPAVGGGVTVVPAATAFTSISGTSARTSSGSLASPRLANARSSPGFTPPPVTPLGGPPQRPRIGSLHAIGPVHSLRIAYRAWKLFTPDGCDRSSSLPLLPMNSRPPTIGDACLNTRSSVMVLPYRACRRVKTMLIASPENGAAAPLSPPSTSSPRVVSSPRSITGPGHGSQLVAIHAYSVTTAPGFFSTVRSNSAA
jgi:hypothetical protein